MAEADNCYFESRIVYVPSCHTRHMGGRRGRTDADALQSRLKSKLRSRRASAAALSSSLYSLSLLSVLFCQFWK